MIRGKYLRERKAIRFKRRIKLLICLLILFILHKMIFSSYSLYESEANSNLDVDVAFFVLENKNLSHSIELGDLSEGETTSCSFSIANFYTEEYVDELDGQTKQKEVIAETDIKYNLKIRTTTNLPLEYELYMNDDPQGNPKAIEQTGAEGGQKMVQDDDKMYFNTLIDSERTFKYNVARTDTYILKITLPKGSVDYSSQGIIDVVEITVDAEQVLDTI